MKLLYAIALLLFASQCLGDIFMHNPRGSNNRLNGQGVNRANNNRMCDTQNNAKGGYVHGPKMYYYVGSQLSIEWTNQHGCGDKNKQKNVYCDVVIQYMCGSNVRDGATTATPPDNEDTYDEEIEDVTGEFGGGMVKKYGLHESFQYYQDCKVRERNRGLFTATQNVGNNAINTRQNPGGGRSGFECPEERDYYPYWHPTPWKDIAILTSDSSRCDYYIHKSENNRARNYCTVPQFNNRRACRENGGSWRTRGHNNAASPVCLEAPMSRDNHLGNGMDGVANLYNWTIPNDVNNNCVLRIRYNISTGDYNGWRTFAKGGAENSPIQNNPDISFRGRQYTLAINTAQFGRTFQDRSHTFRIRSRPSDVLDTERIFNLNVRGKRGNIVQAFPAVEYDFAPVHLSVREGDWIHFQWTGGDTNPQGNDGEGTRGTDRSNMIQIDDISSNIPKKSEFLSRDAGKFANLNQEGCASDEELQARHGNNQDAKNRDPDNCKKLNKASRYFDGGLKEVSLTGTYHFVSTRNNNFSNRSQKSTIVSHPFLPVWAIVLVVFGSVLCLGSIVVSGLAFYGKARPTSAIGRAWTKLT